MSAVGTMIYHGLCRRASVYNMFCCMDVRAVQIYIASTIEEIVSFEFWVFGLVVGVWVGCGCSRHCNVMSSAALVQGIAVATVIKRLSRRRTGGLSLLHYVNV